MSYWGKPQVIREEVVAYLISIGRGEEVLEWDLPAFSGATGEQYGYTHGWSDVLKELKRVFR